MSDKWFYGICTSIIVLIIGIVIFCGIDQGLGTTQTYRENLTVTDVYTKHVLCGKTPITKYYITVKTETGTEDISVTRDLYKMVEVNNDIEVTKTITKTKITKETLVKYEVN